MPRPVKQEELKIVLAYIGGHLSYKDAAKLVGTNNNSVFNWLSSRALRALKSKQIPLSQESK